MEKEFLTNLIVDESQAVGRRLNAALSKLPEDAKKAFMDAVLINVVGSHLLQTTEMPDGSADLSPFVTAFDERLVDFAVELRKGSKEMFSDFVHDAMAKAMLKANVKQ